MKVYFVFFIGGIAGYPFSVFNSTDYEIPEIFNSTGPEGSFVDGKWVPYEWKKKRDKLIGPPSLYNDCKNPDIIVYASDIIDGISINDGGFYRLFGNDGGSPYCINLGDDEFVTGIMFGFHTHRYWATWSGGSPNIDRGHLCGLRIYTNQNIFGPFASWHSQCGKLVVQPSYVPNSMFRFNVPIQTTLESFLQTNSTISAKGMLVIKT